MSQLTRPAQAVVVGWLLVVVFGLLVLTIAHEPRSAAMFCGLGLLMALWVARRPRTAAFVASLVLGLLHTAEEVTYIFYGTSVWSVLGDVVGLVGGVLITGGASVALFRRRHPAVAANRAA